jgi:hypothetical protein
LKYSPFVPQIVAFFDPLAAPMIALGKTLQIVGLTALPVGMFLEVSGRLHRTFGVSDLLVTLVGGVVAFVLGRIIEGYATR